MTRKHFEAMAKVLLETKDEFGMTTYGYNRLVERMADICQETNEHFQRDRFYQACKHGQYDERTEYEEAKT